MKPFSQLNIPTLIHRGGRGRGNRGRGAHRNETQRYQPYVRCTLHLLHKRQTYARRMPNSKETPGGVGKNKQSRNPCCHPYKTNSATESLNGKWERGRWESISELHNTIHLLHLSTVTRSVCRLRRHTTHVGSKAIFSKISHQWRPNHVRERNR